MTAATRYLLSLGCLGLFSVTSLRAEIIEVKFNLHQAVYDPKRKDFKYAPIENVFIVIRPDGKWAPNSEVTPGFSKKPDGADIACMHNLKVDVPDKPPAAAGLLPAFLELLPHNQPWKAGEEYLLWQHGFGNGRYDAPFDLNSRHHPRDVVLVPVKHRTEYYNLVVSKLAAPGESAQRYFSSLIEKRMLQPQYTPSGQLIARKVTEEKEKVIAEAAAFWDVRPEDIQAGFGKWVAWVDDPPGAPNPKDELLRLVYTENLATAARCSLAFMSTTPEDISFLRLKQGIHLVWAGDLFRRADNTGLQLHVRDELTQTGRGALAIAGVSDWQSPPDPNPEPAPAPKSAPAPKRAPQLQPQEKKETNPAVVKSGGDTSNSGAMSSKDTGTGSGSGTTSMGSGKGTSGTGGSSDTGGPSGRKGGEGGASGGGPSFKGDTGGRDGGGPSGGSGKGGTGASGGSTSR